MDTMRRTKGWLDDAHIAEALARANPDEALAITLMADAGCRLGEALAFDPSSLTGNDSLRIYSTKSRAWRTVPVTDRLAHAIREIRRLPGGGRIILSRRTLQRRLLEICAAAGTPPTTPHRLRHSYATRLHAEHVPLATISALLGHRSIAVTLLYIHAGEHDYAHAKKALDRRARRLATRSLAKHS